MNRLQMIKTSGLLACVFTVSAGAQDTFTPSQAAEAQAMMTVPGMWVGQEERPYTIYVESMPGSTWDEKISHAVMRATNVWSGAEIVLPGKTIEITQPIRLWRRRVIEAQSINTMADGVELAYLGNCYTAIKGGTPADLPRGITLRGTSRGATTLVWKGGPNQVVIDMPAPWFCTVSDLSIDGENTQGLIGIRYRAGWEFGRNGGKNNRFADIAMSRLDVAFDVGGPFLPDLVDGSFTRIRVDGARIAFRVVGANVAEMWFSEISIGTVQEAGFRISGYPARLLRRLADKDKPSKQPVVRDEDGREIFLDQVAHLAALMEQQVQTQPDTQVAGSESSPWVGGGGASCFLSSIEAHMHDPRSWLVDAYHSPVRLQNVRMEGCAGLLRSGPRGGRNSRFNDLLIDVNAVSIGGVSGNVIEYDRQNTLVMIGGTLEGPVALGQNATCHVVGTTFMRFPGRTRHGIIPEGAELPADSFFARTGAKEAIPYRRGWMGDKVTSQPQKEPRIVQLRGTSGATVYQLPRSEPPPAE